MDGNENEGGRFAQIILKRKKNGEISRADVIYMDLPLIAFPTQRRANEGR